MLQYALDLTISDLVLEFSASLMSSQGILMYSSTVVQFNIEWRYYRGAARLVGLAHTKQTT